MDNTAKEMTIQDRVKDSDGWSWYGQPGPDTCLSVTTILDPITPKFLSNWFKNNSSNKIEKKLTVAGDFGSSAHEMFAKILNHEPFDIPESHIIHVNNFSRWAEENNVKPLACERTIISGKYGFAGTADFIGEINGKLVVADWKTGNSYSIKNGWQIAAYRLAAIEQGLIPETCGMIGVQVARDTGVVKTFEYTHIDFCEHAFLATLDVFKALYFTKLNKLNWKWLKERAT